MSDFLTDAVNEIAQYFETHEIHPCFYQSFLGELVKIFGVHFPIHSNDCVSEYEEYEDEEYNDFDYKDQIRADMDYFSGTVGWATAFEAACKENGMADIYEDYKSFDWIHGDIFDGYIADMTVDFIFGDEGSGGRGMFWCEE